MEVLRHCYEIAQRARFDIFIAHIEQTIAGRMFNNRTVSLLMSPHTHFTRGTL